MFLTFDPACVTDKVEVSQTFPNTGTNIFMPTLQMMKLSLETNCQRSDSYYGAEVGFNLKCRMKIMFPSSLTRYLDRTSLKRRGGSAGFSERTKGRRPGWFSHIWFSDSMLLMSTMGKIDVMRHMIDIQEPLILQPFSHQNYEQNEYYKSSSIFTLFLFFLSFILPFLFHSFSLNSPLSSTTTFFKF